MPTQVDVVGLSTILPLLWMPCVLMKYQSVAKKYVNNQIQLRNQSSKGC